jgi:hypothetical protein
MADRSVGEIGAGLLEYAEQEAEFSARGLLGELFPYIFQASRRMSARAISRWLAEGPKVKLSAVSIAKALRNPEKYWEEFADFVEPQARIVENALDWPMEEFLYNQEGFLDHVGDKKNLPKVSGDTTEEELCSLDEYRAAVIFLRENWFSLDSSVRDKCWRFFQPKDEEEKSE